MGGSTPSTQTQSTNSSSNSTSDSTTGPNSVIAPKLDSLTNAYWQFLNNNLQAPAYPTGTIAPQSADTLAAIEALRSRGASGGMGQAGATQNLLDIAGGGNLDVSANPYFSAGLAAAFAPQTKQLNDVLLPSIDAKFGLSSRTGSPANINADQLAIDNLNASQSGAAQQAMSTAWGQGLGQQVSALGLLPSFWAADYNDLNAQLQAGQLQDAYAQKQADANTAGYWYNASAQPNSLLNASQILQGIYPGSTTSGNTSSNGSSYGYTTTTPSSNPTSNILGGVLGLGNLGLQAYKTFWPSDERLKDVEGRVGFTDEGLPLYLYRYKGDDQPRIGPMAQEVARVKPDAVARHPSGYLMVDYARAMPSGGLM